MSRAVVILWLSLTTDLAPSLKFLKGQAEIENPVCKVRSSNATTVPTHLLPQKQTSLAIWTSTEKKSVLMNMIVFGKLQQISSFVFAFWEANIDFDF